MANQRAHPSFYANGIPVRLLALTVVPVLFIACGGPPPTSPGTPGGTVTSVSITGATTLTAGQSAQLTATAKWSSGVNENCTQTATWDSSNPAVATVSATGLLTAVGPGDVDVRATFRGTSGTARLHVDAAQGGRPLQIHYLDVGQGDAAIVMTPGGQTVMFDDGPPGSCTALVAALRALEVTRLDYHVASHYHNDHIACAQPVFSAFPLTVGLDRGGSYTGSTYTAYVSATGGARQTALPGSSITLDQGTGSPVRIDIVAVDAGVGDENDRSVVAVMHFGAFDAEFGGDLGEEAEGVVAPRMSRIEAYKVHHHGSATSTSTAWLSAIVPKMAVVSVGNGNTYHHPTQSALDRLHAAGVKTYWTETGAGASPNPAWDVVTGAVTIEVSAGARQFNVRWNGGSDTYAVW